ncbi:unknown protein (plasmid) [Simkania negevensis Z]|uniref:Uncharacterized protein n=1 Tax=Simkania negevensis (strain ATCC VR-1471 / DSM 27360 / Z) TaxID=331113 RepID=F8L2Z8_SIMNZ|nr:unknown protein [Simkania negevensis Z]
MEMIAICIVSLEVVFFWKKNLNQEGFFLQKFND